MRDLQAARGAPLSPNPSGDGGVRRRVVVLVLVAATVLVADIVTKIVAVDHLTGRRVRLLGGLVKLVEVRNSGAAFGLAAGATVVFTAVAVGVVIAIARTARRLRSTAWAVVLGLLLGGATGNLVDRMLRAPGPFRGRVVDWIELPHWPVFNLADSAIVVGGLLAVILASRGIGLEGDRSR